MSEQSNILDTVKTKLIQASSDTVNNDGREVIRKDVNKLLEEFDNIASQTNYNGKTLLQKSKTDTSAPNTLSFQMGEYEGFDVNLKPTRASNTSALGGGSDTIFSGSVGASINNGTTSTTANNNIAVAGSQQINLSTSITLQNVDIKSAGTETESATIKFNVDVSGKIGGMAAATKDATIDISSQSQDIKDAVKAIAANNSNFADNSDGTYTLTQGQSVDFGNLDFSAVKIKQAADNAGSVSLNTKAVIDTSLVISDNNTGTDNPLLGQINMDMGGVNATGGKTLKDIKDLKEGELTHQKANEFMKTIDTALTQLNINRADFGSTQNQLESSMRSMTSTTNNLKKAEMIIRDVDYSKETAYFNKQNIIAQAGSYAMSQATKMTENITKLLQ